MQYKSEKSRKLIIKLIIKFIYNERYNISRYEMNVLDYLCSNVANVIIIYMLNRLFRDVL